LLGVMDDFDPDRAGRALRSLGADIPMIRTAARRTPDIVSWLDWLQGKLDWRRFAAAAPAANASLMGV
jgi:hypothetical protein